MSETNALAVLGGQSGPVARYDDEVFGDLTIQGGFLPRLNLYTGRSKIVEKGLFKANHWGVVTGKDKLHDLGEDVVCVPMAYRPMALDLREKKAVAYFDPKSEKFKEVQKESNVKDSKCMAGVQFLVFVQGFGLATYYCASKSAKMLAPHIRKLLNQYVKLGSHTVESGDFVYRAPTIVISNVVFDLPDPQALIAKRNEFINVGPVVETDKDLENPDLPGTEVTGGTEARPR